MIPAQQSGDTVLHVTATISEWGLKGLFQQILRHITGDTFFKWLKEIDPQEQVTDGAARIGKERNRQITEEHWDSRHDSHHDHEQLIVLAAAYLLRDANLVPDGWGTWYKPSSKNRIRELEKAGALVAAEIDHLLAK